MTTSEKVVIANRTPVSKLLGYTPAPSENLCDLVGDRLFELGNDEPFVIAYGSSEPIIQFVDESEEYIIDEQQLYMVLHYTFEEMML